MSLIDNILGQIVERLHRGDHLELAHGASLADVHRHLREDLQAQGGAVKQLNSWLLSALERSPHLDEIYLTDEELSDLIRQLTP